MLILLSPSKTQDFQTPPIIKGGVVSLFNNETKNLSKIMKNYSSQELGKMMKVSDNLAELNFDRFQKWNSSFKKERGVDEGYNFKPSIFAFKGDVYHGFDLENYSKSDFNYAERHLRIVSGFYGLMTPMTYLKPYRLEMGTRVSFTVGNKEYKNLYDFWGTKLTEKVVEDLNSLESKYILNLASIEYSKSIDLKSFEDDVINADFKVSKNGSEKIIAIFAKKQRGEMANWVIQNRVESIEDLKKYKNAGFKYSAKSTKEVREKTGENNRMVFVRKDK